MTSLICSVIEIQCTLLFHSRRHFPLAVIGEPAKSAPPGRPNHHRLRRHRRMDRRLLGRRYEISIRPPVPIAPRMRKERALCHAPGMTFSSHVANPYAKNADAENQIHDPPTVGTGARILREGVCARVG